MQCQTSRQTVTGLTVNKKVNIRADYYRKIRAMCHSLFQTGTYVHSDGIIVGPSSALSHIEGALNHIYHVKELAHLHKANLATVETKELNLLRQNLKGEKFAARDLYAKFLFYKYFLRLDHTLIICEGPNIYKERNSIHFSQPSETD
jgi:hypothetical protein